MKAIINCYRNGLDWTNRFFPGISPYMLPVLNKPNLEYLLDFCSMMACRDVLILDSEYDASTADFLGDGVRWNLHITYRGEENGGSLIEAFSRNNTFFSENEEVFCCNGYCFPRFDQKHLPKQEELAGAEVRKMPDCGLYVRSASGVFHHLSEKCGVSEVKLTRVIDYFKLNMDVLEFRTSNYVIPGYNIENRIYTGMNVVMKPSVQIEPPAVLGDNISLEQDCRINGYVVLGSGVFVDTRSLLSRCIVFGDTYIASDLEFINKIVYRNFIIDPGSETVLNLFDLKLTAGPSTKTGDRMRRWGACIIASLMIFLMSPLFFFFLCIGAKKKGDRRIFSWRSRFPNYPVTFEIPVYAKKNPSGRRSSFYQLSMDKYPLLFQVLRGNMSLVGDFPYNADLPGTKDFIRSNYPQYRAGVFFLSEASASVETMDKTAKVLDDLYLKYKNSWHFKITVMIRCLIRRLFGDNEPLS